MKKIGVIFGIFIFAGKLFAQTNANDTQSAIVNSLLIQQLMQMQQNQQNQPAQNNLQSIQNSQYLQADAEKKIETEDDLKVAGFSRYRFDDDAEDYMVFKNNSPEDVEIEIWAADKRNRLQYYGTIFVDGNGYKGNPLKLRIVKLRSLEI